MKRACESGTRHAGAPAPPGSPSRPAFRSCPQRSPGTDGLSHLQALRVAFGDPIPLDDLADQPLDDAAQTATDRLSARIAELEETLR